jgi:hypothetical protein
MGLIVQAAFVLRILILILFEVLLLHTWRIWKGLASASLRFAPFSGGLRFQRFLMGALSLALFAALLWAISQDYLFLTSVFPKLAPWMGLSLLYAAMVLMASAMVSRMT